MKKITLFIFTLVFLPKLAFSQQLPAGVDTTIIKTELQRRGLDDTEVRKRLEAKGVDLERIRPEDLPRVQRLLEETIAEMEQEAKILKENAAKNEDEQIGETDENERTALDITNDSVPRKRKTALPKKTKKTETDPLANEDDDLSEKPRRKTRRELEHDSIENANKIYSIEEAFGEKPVKAKRKKTDDTTAPAYIYGQQIFRNGQLNFIKEKDVRAPDTYILSTGDKITISISGQAYFNQTYTLNTEGYIQPDRMPRIFLKGMPLGRARRNLQTNFSRYYPFAAEDFLVSVNTVRTITVNIVGEVFNPGSYTISAGNTAFNALIASGGPTNIGSVRNIQVVRSNTGEKRRLDVYEFLLDPSVSKDFYLFENDYISVPVAERLVSVSGAVKRPFKYELTTGENLMKALSFAGGLSENAYQATLQVKRFVNDREKIIDVNYKDLKARGGDFDLLNGDSIVIKTIPLAFENFATVLGEVEIAGKFEITEGMRLTDLLKKAVLKKEAKTDIAYLQRTNSDQTMQLRLVNINEILSNPNSTSNLVLSPKDRLLIYAQEKFTSQDSVFIMGAVKTPLRFPFDPARTIRISDLVNLAGGLKPEATDFAYIVRRDPRNKKLVEYKRVELKIALENTASPENFLLEANDELQVKSRLNYSDESFVRVGGAVRVPGEYKWDETLTLRDALVLAGGLRLQAASNRIDVFRVQIVGNEQVKTIVATIEVDKSLNFKDDAASNFALQPFDQIIVRNIPEFSFQKIVTIVGEVRFPGEYAILDKNEKLMSLIQRAGGLSAESFPSGATLFRGQDNIGYVIISLPEAIKNSNSNHNIILKDGDLIEIPKIKDIVTIRGATKAIDLYPEKILAAGKINVAFEGNSSALYYIEKYAAGIGERGRKRLISVEHPNGQIERTKDYLLFKVYPRIQKGSIITVGAVEKKPEPKKGERKEIEWNKVLADSIAQATALLSFILLIQRLN
jgi:protein involved in polysaccharide export with SLBB domain